jgi:transposase
MEAAPNKRSCVRLSAVRALLMGYSRRQACELNDRTDRMVRLRNDLFNRGGIDALITKSKRGRPRKVKLERVRNLLLPVLENPASAGQVHRTGVKLRGCLKEQLALELGYRTTVRWLHELNFHWRVPQPWPDRQTRKSAKPLSKRCTRSVPIPTWSFGLVMGAASKAIRGRAGAGSSRENAAPVPYVGDHVRQNVIGAVGPQNSALFSLIVDGVDTDVLQFFSR